MRTNANPRGSPRTRLISSLAMLVVVAAGMLFYSVRETGELLDIGVAAHAHCTDTAGDPGLQFVPMLQALPEAAGAGYTVASAHPCSANGRDYIHIVLQQNQTPVSVVLTLRRGQEVFPRSLTGGVVETAGIAIHEGRREGYSVAAFDSGPWLGYVVSALSTQQNGDLAARLAPVIDRYTKP